MQTAVNGLGTVAVAAIGAGSKVYTMFVCPFDAMGATVATWCGQNLGARRLDRVRQGVRISVLSMTVYAFVALFAVRLLGRPMIGLFITGGETAVIDKAVQYLNMVVMFFIPLLLIFVLRNALQGLGYSRVAMLAGLFELVGRAFVAFALVGPYGFDGAILANPAAWIMADALLIPVYLHTVRALQQCHAGVPGRVAG
jgi:Na+-driven multidrug efflux pump